MKLMIILANGFEDSEAITTIDVLKRANFQVDLVSVDGNLNINTQYNIYIKAEYSLKDINPLDYDALVIPGGKAVFNVLDKSDQLSDLINTFSINNRLIAAICAGPSQVGKLGLYKDHNYTCFPGTEKSISSGTYKPELGVVRDGKFITAKSMAYAIDFGLEIIDFLEGSTSREKVRKSIYAE